MILTILLSLVMMAGLFLMLLSGVGFIQDKKFFASAPQEVQAVVQPREERFPGAHAIGWCMAVISILMMGGAVVYGAWDGIRNGFSFGQFFARFLIMLWGLKAYDILFLMLSCCAAVISSRIFTRKRSPFSDRICSDITRNRTWLTLLPCL